MRIAIGSDHRGVNLKNGLAQFLQEQGHEVDDEGTHDNQSVDYPDIASAVSGKVSSGQVDRGILICGTGIGMQITANKFAGVRAATVQDEFSAEICRRHNDVNVLCLSGDRFSERGADQIVSIWLNTEFEAGRHARRVDKIRKLEE